jgi:hypothetical protein
VTLGHTLRCTYAVRFLFPLGWRSESAEGVGRVLDGRGVEEGGSPGLLAEELGLSWPASSTDRKGGDDEEAGDRAWRSIVEVPVRSRITNAC